jgi:CelD/BcsL family acetyltransferase involved in cellulose biosynthesis
VELERLIPEWRDLWERCPYATPFQSPEWLVPWWEAFHPGRLKCLERREGGRLVGLAPMYEDEDGIARLLGEGNTDYLDALVEPGCGAAWIYEQAGRAYLYDLRPQSPLVSEAPEWAGITGGEVCPVLELPATVEEWRNALPHGLKRNLRRYGERLPEARFAESRDPALIEDLIRLHDARWSMRGQPGVLRGDAVARFHRAAASGFAARGWLRFWTLHSGASLAAIIYAFVCRGRAYFYSSGFLPALARLGPGTLAIGRAIESLIAEGVGELDFLRGAEAYKFAWGARPRRSVNIACAGGERAG